MLRLARRSLALATLVGLAGCELFAGIESPTLDRPDGGPASGASAVLEVGMRGNVLGHITSMPEGIDCPGTCRASFAPGTAVTLTADPPGDDVASGKRFIGWDATTGCTDAAAPCVVALPAAGVTIGARFYLRSNVAFVTSTVTDGAFGGLDVADIACTQLAAQAGLPPGPYVAWLSTRGGADARDRLGAGSGWVRTDGKPFARSRTDLLAGRILYPLRLDERGRDVVDADNLAAVFTGTAPDGTATFGDCQGWTLGSCGSDCVFPADSGSPGGGTVRWTAALTGSSCARTQHLYCLGIGTNAPPPALPAPGPGQAKLWLSTVPYLPGEGDVEDLCKHDAADFGFDPNLAMSIHAALGRTPVAIALPAGSLPPTHFVRPDGVIAVDSLLDLVDGHGFRAPINVTPDKIYYGGDDELVWLGATEMNQVATDSVCDDLTTGLDATRVADTALSTIRTQIASCTERHRVWCTELKLEPL